MKLFPWKTIALITDINDNIKPDGSSLMRQMDDQRQLHITSSRN